MEPLKPAARPTSALTAVRSRRDILKLAGLAALSVAAVPILEACGSPAASSGAPSASAGTAGPSGSTGAGASQALSGAVTALQSSDLTTNPPVKKVYDDFLAMHPDVTWDNRALPTSHRDWDRIARATIAGGEPVDFVVINGQYVRAWARDGLLANLNERPGLESLLKRVPKPFHLTGPSETATRAFGLAIGGGVFVTALMYNKALFDQAGVKPPATIDDFKAMVDPLGKIGVAPTVFPGGESSALPLLVMWLLPMIAERNGTDPLTFVEDTQKGTIRYDSPEWVEMFQIIDDLRSSGVLLAGSGAMDSPTAQQLFIEGKAATYYNGSWAIGGLTEAAPSGPFDLQIAGLPLVEGASTAHPLSAFVALGIAEGSQHGEIVEAFLRYAGSEEVDESVVKETQQFSPLESSNDVVKDPLAQQLLPFFPDAIPPLDWLWEPEITVAIGEQGIAVVNGRATATEAGQAVQAVADELRASGGSFFE